MATLAGGSEKNHRTFGVFGQMDDEIVIGGQLASNSCMKMGLVCALPGLDLLLSAGRNEIVGAVCLIKHKGDEYEIGGQINKGESGRLKLRKCTEKSKIINNRKLEIIGF